MFPAYQLSSAPYGAGLLAAKCSEGTSIWLNSMTSPAASAFGSNTGISTTGTKGSSSAAIRDTIPKLLIHIFKMFFPSLYQDQSTTGARLYTVRTFSAALCVSVLADFRSAAVTNSSIVGWSNSSVTVSLISYRPTFAGLKLTRLSLPSLSVIQDSSVKLPSLSES
ncbi:hypothetical protein D3C75_982160 [compost metagenome]